MGVHRDPTKWIAIKEPPTFTPEIVQIDSRLFAPGGVTLVDSYTWTAHASTTYARCPDGTGAFQTATTSTKGTANDCGAAVRINEVESSGGAPGHCSPPPPSSPWVWWYG
jgi:hypothetical protein